jgi:hypothetical protein
MWVQGTGSSFEVHVQKADAQLPLRGLELSGYDGSVLTSAGLFDIEEVQLVVGAQCDDVDRPLRHDRLVDVAPLCYKPRRSNKFCLGSVLNSVIYSHCLLDSPE